MAKKRGRPKKDKTKVVKHDKEYTESESQTESGINTDSCEMDDLATKNSNESTVSNNSLLKSGEVNKKN